MERYTVELVVDATLRIDVEASTREEAMQKAEAEIRADMLYPDLDYVDAYAATEVL